MAIMRMQSWFVSLEGRSASEGLQKLKESLSIPAT
jgi:hypothetical protein